MNDIPGATFSQDEDALLFPDDQRRMVTFLLRLPFQLPVPHGHLWTLGTAGHLGATWDEDVFLSPFPGVGFEHNLRSPIVFLRVWQPVLPRTDPSTDGLVAVTNTVFPANDADPEVPGADDASAPPTEVPQNYETILQALTQGARSDTEDGTRPVGTTCFDRALGALNEVLEALSEATGSPTSSWVAREQLGPIAIVGSFPVESGAFDVGPHAYWVNGNVDLPPEPLDDAVLMRALVILSTARSGQPMRTYLRLARRASAGLQAGDYPVAVLMAAASGEVLLNTILRALLIEEGHENEIATVFGSGRDGLVGRLRSQYAARLGGAWDLETWTTAPGHWEQSARRVRHRVIHTGHLPTFDEANEAVHGTELLVAFVKDRLAEKRFDYPKTALTMLGTEGLEARGMLNARMQGVVSEIAPSISTFWASITED